MSVSIFIDSNILIYLHDEDEGEKYECAVQCVHDLLEDGTIPTVSVQVLQELHVNLLKKGMSFVESSRLVRLYAHWNVVSNTLALLFSALDIQKRFKLSFWDASIVAAALQAGCRELWTEDLQDGQRFDGLIVRNPLRLE